MEMYIVPKKDLSIRDPKTYRPLPPQGAFVEVGTFWLKRIADGDVIRVDVQDKAKFLAEQSLKISETDKKVVSEKEDVKKTENKKQANDKKTNGGI